MIDFLKVTLNTWETLFVAVCAAALYFKGGAHSGLVIGLGYVACLSFIPSYRVLIVGAPLVSSRALFGEFIFGLICVVIIKCVLNENKPNEMSILFFSSYLAGKSLRFLLTVIYFNFSKSARL